MMLYRQHDDSIVTSKEYLDHVSAMTSENLYSKADIAEELAWRDMQIESLRRDAERYRWLRTNCIIEIPANRDGPSHKLLRFTGECYADWKFAIDHIGLDAAIDAAMKGEK